MRVLIAAGGTGGHVNPALAVAGAVKKAMPGAEILFVGRKDGIEYGLVNAAGYSFAHINVHGFQRRLTLENIRRNIAALFALAFSGFRARKILKDFAPDVCIGTGGYVSGPVIREAAKKGIPAAIHEQNAFPGVTNKLLAKKVDVIFAASPAAAQRLGQKEKTLIVGNPVRSAIFEADRGACKAALGAGGRPVLLSFGGSLGAAPLNRAVAELAAWHLAHENYLHIHATGAAGKEEFCALMNKFCIAPGPNFTVQEYIEDMPSALAAADLVICRAGALTISELAAAGRAAVLVPSPYVSENHQYHNAKEVVDAGAAIMLEEKNLTGAALVSIADELFTNRSRLTQMENAAKALATPASATIIAEKLFEMVKS